MSREAAQLAERGAGRCTLAGNLTLQTAPWLWRELTAGGLLTSATEADLAGVTGSDSAGLALLVAWRAGRRQAGGELNFINLPERLRLLTALTGAEGALSPTGAPGSVGA
jgi:phospholipid transport system transporter-binding protein